MHYLYGIKKDGRRELVATFSSGQQLLAYVRWATLEKHDDGTYKFEQKTPLVGCTGYEHGSEPPEGDVATDVPHNPSPGML